MLRSWRQVIREGAERQDRFAYGQAPTHLLARYWDTTPDFWLNLQTHYDLMLAKKELAGRIKQEVQARERAA